MLDKITDAMQFSAEALKLRARRQEVLTSNITNANTPNYKAVDFDFGKVLQQVTGDSKQAAPAGGLNAAQATSVSLNATHAGHFNFSSTNGQSTDVMLKFRRGAVGALDGNSVDIEKEKALIAENQVKYEAALRMINGRISSLKQAMGSSN